MFNPIYSPGKLFGAHKILHGVAKNIEGPYDWKSHPNISLKSAINPAFLVFHDTAGDMKYSLWTKGMVQVADTPNGPFEFVRNSKSPEANPAPIWHEGAFYLSCQHTRRIWTTKELGKPWVVHANISNASVPAGMVPEDPFMWIDKRNNWHIINHAYDTSQLDHCGSSRLSTHFYSADGMEWDMLVPNVEPYGHTVHWDDNTSHTYTTLERPNLYFNTEGELTHIHLAADLVTGDEGCKDIPNCHAKGEQGKCPCVNCKYTDHAGTIVVALGV